MITNPIVVTTPRTGGTLFTKVLADSLNKVPLYEFFSTRSKQHPNSYIVNDGKIELVDFGALRHHELPNDHDAEVERRRELLLGHEDQYLIKLLSYEFRHRAVSDIMTKYQPVFLERRDKMAQILSYCAIIQSVGRNGTFHHTEESEPIGSIFFDEKLAKEIVITLKQYNNIKKKCGRNAPVIFYEDFMWLGGDSFALNQLLGTPITPDAPFEFQLTKYSKPKEELVVNLDEWLTFKERYKDL